MAELLAYEPPRLDPLTFTAVGKHLTGDILTGSKFDEQYDVSQLMAAYGSPLFIVSESMLRQLYRGFRNSFSSDAIDTKVAYSYKTNYPPAICAILQDEGAWAEVVSGMEYNLARALDVPANEIIFNGPYKSRQELEMAFSQGALVNVDNIDELDLAGVIARDLGHECRIGLRVSFKFGLSPWTKFGFNEENGDAQLALERIANSPKLNLELLHNHSGTFLLNQDSYAKAAEVLIGISPWPNVALWQKYDLRCSRCGDLLKPAVIAFGEEIPPKAWRDAQAAVQSCGVLIVIGTQLAVSSAAEIVARARIWCNDRICQSGAIVDSLCLWRWTPAPQVRGRPAGFGVLA